MKLMAVSLTALLGATTGVTKCEFIEPTTCEAAIGLAWIDKPPEVRTRMQRIAWRESRNIPTARNRTSSATGCLQLLRMHEWRFRKHGWTWADATNAWRNAVVARDLWNEAGWSPWALTS